MHNGRHWYDCPAARLYVMSEEERQAQRRSFAYGNAAIGNPRVTREMIDMTAERIDAVTARTLDVKRKAALGWFMRLLLRLAKWFIRRYTL